MQKVPMTKLGSDQLRDELTLLKTKKRPEVIEAIATARAHGDLKENAEYHAAREQQGFIEARIRDIEGKLSHAQIIDVESLKNEGKVVFGATVHLLDVEKETQVVYTIVGDDEAEIKQKKISYSSPIARALIGREEGDVVAISVPKGEVEYEIDQVVYGAAD
jgi:transcription elongation factor GreA